MARDRSRRPARPERVGARAVRLGIVASEYHREVTDAMLEDALRAAEELGATVGRTLRVPGVYDIPVAVRALLKRRDLDAVVTIGAVVKGETDHDALITHAVAASLLELSTASGKPVTLGITGPGETLAQAKARIDRGGHAVRAAVTLVVRLRAL